MKAKIPMRPEKILVSVNITTFNRGHLLARCLDSVIRQTHKNLEINIVDDCSSDQTGTIARDYCSKDRRIRYYRHNCNSGNAKARNTALRNTRGEYVAFLDDDDLWIDDEKIEKQIACFLNAGRQNLGIVCSGIARVDVRGNETAEMAYRPEQLNKVLLKGGLIHNSTAMVRFDVISEVGWFDEKMQRGVDSEFFRRVIVSYGYDVEFLKDITCRYHEDSPGRMTPQKSMESIRRVRNANCYLIFKYFRHNLRYPEVLILRVKNVVRSQLALLMDDR